MIDIKKITRLFIGAFLFLCITSIPTIATRETHQFFFMLGAFILFGLLLENLWLTLFLWWSVFLYAFFKFQIGYVYLLNIFCGCILYYLTKKSFTKEHLDWLIDKVLWVLVINLFLGVLQVCKLDFMFIGAEQLFGYGARHDLGQTAPFGFMANTGVMATLIALCMPLLASRKGNLATFASLGLCIPLYYLHSTCATVAAVVALLLTLYFKLTKRLFWLIASLFILLGVSFFLMRVDTMGAERFSMWKLVLIDCNTHPLTGWGMDSFRNLTQMKPHLYASMVGEWDNPHCLYIGLLFEFGFLSLVFLGGYLKDCYKKLRRIPIDRNVVALAGFLIALLITSIGQFPMYLTRLVVITIPILAFIDIMGGKNGQGY